MKKIEIDKYTPPDKDSVYTAKRKYRIALGNGVIFSFKDKKKLVYYLTLANKELTNVLHEIILLNIEVYNQFWQSWLYLDIKCNRTTNITRDLYKKIEDSCINEFWHIPPKLQLAVRRSNAENGNHFVFQHLNNSLDSLKFILENTLLLRKIKIQCLEARRINLLIKDIERVKIKLNNIGKNADKKD